jgi:hypothetical protein
MAFALSRARGRLHGWQQVSFFPASEDSQFRMPGAVRTGQNQAYSLFI